MMDQNNFSILLLDINLPGISGLLFLKGLRKKYPKEELYIIMISGMAQEINVQKSLEDGADYFIKKPIDLSKLKEIILSRYAS